MIQAFYTASAGMQAQQKNIDVISNNISNVNTPGYRIKRAEFQELLDFQTGKNNERVTTGYGTKIANITTMSLPDDINPLGMEIVGEGYFAVEDENGNRSYTKNGDFIKLERNGAYYLATKNNDYVLDVNNNRIQIDNNIQQALVSNGLLYPQGNNGEEGIRLAIYKFDSVEGLAMKNKDQYIETEYSSKPYLSTTSSVNSNYYDELAPLAMANQISEITRVVQTQMAYQLNSKTLQIVDEMAGMANHLRY